MPLLVHSFTSMVPAPFRKLGVLRTLNVAAVGLSLAAATGTVLGRTFFRDGDLAIYCAATTLVVGCLWAALLRSERTVGKTSVRVGYALSPIFAAGNAALAAAIGFRHPAGLVAGALFGAILWVPALVATLLCFGLPIAHAQRLAKRGLAGEERGEAIVGSVCVLVSAVATWLALDPLRWRASEGSLRPHAMLALSALGLATGAAAVMLALGREVRRRRFVQDAEQGRAPGFRVDPSVEGKVLVRVTSQGEGYRVVDLEEELFELDAEGQATRPRQRAAVAP